MIMDELKAYNDYCNRRNIRLDIKAFQERRKSRLDGVNKTVDNCLKGDIIKAGERRDADFEESKHPRAKNGQFAKKGESSGSKGEEISGELEEMLYKEQPSSDRLAVGGREARELYDNIKSGKYLEIDDLLSHPVVRKLDAISQAYDRKYGVTADINTPERKEIRKKIREEFLKMGSARKTKDENGREKYVFDGPLKKEFKATVVIGLPASGKSTSIANPQSEKNGAFVFDSDIIKESIPEFQESFGGAANAVHKESGLIQENAFDEFLSGSLKGTNMMIPIIGSNYDKLMDEWIKLLEDAGYDVDVQYKDADSVESANRNIARELDSGRIIPSRIVLGYGDKPKKVFEMLKGKKNKKGKHFVVEGRE